MLKIFREKTNQCQSFSSELESMLKGIQEEKLYSFENLVLLFPPKIK